MSSILKFGIRQDRYETACEFVQKEVPPSDKKLLTLNRIRFGFFNLTYNGGDPCGRTFSEHPSVRPSLVQKVFVATKDSPRLQPQLLFFEPVSQFH